MNAEKDLASYFTGEPPGQRTNAVRWLQKQVMAKARALPRSFTTREEWEAFKARLRRDLPGRIGIPSFPAIDPARTVVRARVKLGEDLACERLDIPVDDGYAIPAFVIRPAETGGRGGSGRSTARLPALVWNGGWPQDKWNRNIQLMAARIARRGFAVLLYDHAPFGETTPFGGGIGWGQMDRVRDAMTLVMGMGHVLGFSQLGLRAAETMRCGAYLRSRPDVDPARVALAGLCQGGQDTWLAGALDDGFAALAPFCSESTFAIHFAEMASYHANGDSSPFPFGILDVCDIDHLHAAIAPRPLMVRTNLPDTWWPVSGMDDVETLTRKVYRLYGAEDRVDFRAEVHEHDITGPFVDALESFLVKHLA
jgi:dienelactone hydrolase